MTPRTLAPGTMLSGRYQLAEVIGESDLSTVYAATDLRGSAQIALKVFDPAVKARVAALSEYQSQARQASGIGVEGIARAYDFGIDANTGVPFSTSERVSWGSLDRRMLSHGPLGVGDLSRSIGVLARALDAAHAARLVHRDLKPQNIFISPENPEWVRITDFGVTAVRRTSPEALGWGGPPGYTPADAVDAAAPGTPGADLFALGVIVFFALTRATPFRSLRLPGFDPNSHWSELNQALYPVSERAKEVGVALDPAFDTWFARALALQPHDRFRNAGEMARELTAIADQVAARGGGGPRSMPGIAAAIAQPLVFQPEPSPASLGLAGTAPQQHSPMGAMAAAAPAVSPPTMLSSPNEPVAGLPKKGSKLPLFLALGVLLFGGVAFAGYKVLSKGGDKPSAEPAASASAAASAVAAAPSVAKVASGPARAKFSCQPQACEWVVCDGKNLTSLSDEQEVPAGAHECSASKFGFGSKSLTYTATAGQLSEVVFELPPLPPTAQQKAAAAAPAPAAKPAAAPAAKPAAAPAAKPAAAPAAAKPAAAAAAKPAAAATKPAAAAPAAKPAAKEPAGKTKKKCSAFLGCK